MGGGGSSVPADQTKTFRFAPYIESRHDSFLGEVASRRQDIILATPYGDYTDVDFSTAFLGAGYVISDFPALYDMFGKFMSGFDIEVLWKEIFDENGNLSEINGTVAADMNLINGDAEITDIPTFSLEMRNQNAVGSSSFVIGKAKIEKNLIKKMASISAEAKFKILPTINSKFNEYLNWQKEVVDKYAEVMKLYYMTAVEVNDVNYSFAARNLLWPFYVLDFERASLGTMRQQAKFDKLYAPRKRSDLSKAFLIGSYTVTGASIGGQVGGYYGAIVGAVIGFVVGVAMVLIE